MLSLKHQRRVLLPRWTQMHPVESVVGINQQVPSDACNHATTSLDKIKCAAAASRGLRSKGM